MLMIHEVVRTLLQAGLLTGAAASTTQEMAPASLFWGDADGDGLLDAVAIVELITDPTGSGCIQASSTPTLGDLYPLGLDFNIAANGNVGIGTTSPAAGTHITRDSPQSRLAGNTHACIHAEHGVSENAARERFLNASRMLRGRPTSARRQTRSRERH
jgi:hypothetical protein